MTASSSRPEAPRQDGRATRAFRWDLAIVALAILAVLITTFVLDTGWLAQWLASNKQAKIDEILVVSFMLLCGGSVYWMRRWLALSYRLVQVEEGGLRVDDAAARERDLAQAADRSGPFTAARARSTARTDLLIVSVVTVLAAVTVSALDTGALAEWIAQQSHTRVDEALVSVFVLMIGLTIFSMRRWAELSRQLIVSEALRRRSVQLNQEATVLGELSDLLQSCRTLDEAHHLLTGRAAALFPGSSGAVCVIANSRDIVDVMAVWGEPSIAERVFVPADCWALRRGRSNIVGAHASGVRCSHIGDLAPARTLCVPMMAQGNALGLLYLDGGAPLPGETLPPRDWSNEELRLARTLAEQAALALANLELRESLRLQSIRDPLTGLYNRRFLEESLERELRRSSRRDLPLGLMMIDADHFKQLNDTAGHEAGDTVLRELADLFRSHLRAEDIVCRYGGEEFTMLLPDASLEATRERAEALREAVSHLLVQWRGQTLPRLTISVGIASSPEHGATAEALLRAADAALYRAKASGRNRVLTAEHRYAIVPRRV